MLIGVGKVGETWCRRHRCTREVAGPLSPYGPLVQVYGLMECMIFARRHPPPYSYHREVGCEVYIQQPIFRSTLGWGLKMGILFWENVNLSFTQNKIPILRPHPKVDRNRGCWIFDFYARFYTFDHPCSFKIDVFRSFYGSNHPHSLKNHVFASSIQKRKNYIALFGMGRFWEWEWGQRAPIPIAYPARCLICKYVQGYTGLTWSHRPI